MVESIKKAFTLSTKAVKLFYLAAAVNVISNVINLLVVPQPAGSEMSVGRSLSVLILTLLSFVIGVFIAGGIFARIKELIKTGALNLASFINDARKYFLQLLSVALIILLALLIVGALLAVILGIVPNVLRIIIMVAVFVALAVFLIMIPYALVGSDLNITESIKKGILMGKKYFLQILVIMLIMFGIAVVVMIAASIITGILSFILRPLSNFITAIVMAIASAAIAVLGNIAYMDFYLKSETTQENVQS
jgi:hypothetical protein